MAARTHYVSLVIDSLKADIDCCAEKHGISADLLWIVVRQQCDYELLLLADQQK